MADKPSRALVIYGDGLASFVSPSHANLHSFASGAACGFLSLRASPPSDYENDRAIRELAQLLDAYDSHLILNQHGEGHADSKLKMPSVPTLSDRFMGLRAAFVTNSQSLGSYAESLGFSLIRTFELTKNNDHSELSYDGSDDSCIPTELLKLIGFFEGKVLFAFEFDLVFLHVGSNTESTDGKEKIKMNLEVDWADKLVGRIMQMANPGSIFASRLHLSVLLSYGSVPEGDRKLFSLSNLSEEMNSDLSLLRPRQSNTMKGGNILDNIRHDHPMLLAQLQDGVTRLDMANTFSFENFKEHGGNLAILADRFIHELAFKLWKAPKYGA